MSFQGISSFRYFSMNSSTQMALRSHQGKSERSPLEEIIGSLLDVFT